MSFNGHQRKRQRWIEPSTELEELQDELLIEIFCRVRNYKDLMRCKCVSNRWFSLISNPDSVSRHRLLSMKKLRSWTFMYISRKTNKLMLTSNDSVFQSEGFSLRFLPCYRLNEQVPIHILHAFNDLILCCENEFCQRDYYVCNPLTMHWVAIPPSSRYHIHFPGQFVNLICEEHELGTAMSIFKVVRINIRIYRYEYDISALNLEIFSSKSGQWVERNVILLSNKPFDLSLIKEVVICNQTLFALASDIGQIMVLNLNSLINNGTTLHNHYHLLQLPKGFKPLERQKLAKPVACQGRLRVVHIVFNIVHRVPILYIWELKEKYYNVKAADDDECWSLVHLASFTEMVSNSEWFSNMFKTWFPHEEEYGLQIRVLDFQPYDENILSLSFNGRIASYDILNKTLTFHPMSLDHEDVVFQLVLPLCPTKLPKLPKFQHC